MLTGCPVTKSQHDRQEHSRHRVIYWDDAGHSQHDRQSSCHNDLFTVLKRPVWCERGSEDLLNLPERTSTKTLLFCFTRRFDNKTSFDKILESLFSEGTRDPTLYSSPLPLEETWEFPLWDTLTVRRIQKYFNMSDVFLG